MGKKNFGSLYRRIKSELGGEVTCKTSYYCDVFNPTKNYAGILIYLIDGKCRWNNSGGRACGYGGKSFYLIVQSTDDWPPEQRREAGAGRVHHYPLLNVLGIDHAQDRIACGGFAYHQGNLKYSSIWLNQRPQMGTESDRNKMLSDKEKRLVEYCFNQYKSLGKHTIFTIPDSLDRELST